MSSSEFSEWCAFYGMDPFGSVRSDFQSGQICATMANIVSDKKFSVEDFMLRPSGKYSQNANKKVHNDSITEETRVFLSAMGAIRNGDTSTS